MLEMCIWHFDGLILIDQCSIFYTHEQHTAHTRAHSHMHHTHIHTHTTEKKKSLIAHDEKLFQSESKQEIRYDKNVRLESYAFMCTIDYYQLWMICGESNASMHQCIILYFAKKIEGIDTIQSFIFKKKSRNHFNSMGECVIVVVVAVVDDPFE